MRESVKTQVTIENKVDFARSFARSLPVKCATCRAHDWNVKSHNSWFSRVFREYGLLAKYLRNILFCYFGISATPCLHPHYIYPHYPHIGRSAFQRENPRYYPWELEITILTILYAILCGFPQLLPFHIQILKRLIAQTLTTPIMSVKWGFGAAGKYWKKPIIWQMQLG